MFLGHTSSENFIRTTVTRRSEKILDKSLRGTCRIEKRNKKEISNLKIFRTIALSAFHHKKGTPTNTVVTIWIPLCLQVLHFNVRCARLNWCQNKHYNTITMVKNSSPSKEKCLGVSYLEGNLLRRKYSCYIKAVLARMHNKVLYNIITVELSLLGWARIGTPCFVGTKFLVECICRILVQI